MIDKRNKEYSVIIGILFLLTSCSGGNMDLIKYINDIKTRPAKPIEPIPQFSPLPTFKFPENDTRRSPFKPTDRQKNLYAPDINRKKEPLEAFPLDALKFVGTLQDNGKTWALIQQPDKQIIRVGIGNYMGQNYGRVIVITKEILKLEETTQNSSGMWEKKITTINLDTGKKVGA